MNEDTIKAQEIELAALRKVNKLLRLDLSRALNAQDAAQSEKIKKLKKKIKKLKDPK